MGGRWQLGCWQPLPAQLEAASDKHAAAHRDCLPVTQSELWSLYPLASEAGLVQNLKRHWQPQLPSSWAEPRSRERGTSWSRSVRGMAHLFTTSATPKTRSPLAVKPHK